jgi:predicted NBD/HSP70 family sugar kinase
MIAAGIDLGGTKIEAQLFDLQWNKVASRRIATPKTYAELVAAMADQIAWVEAAAGSIPIGISAAGLINPASGLALTANLPASGQPFPADIAKAAGRRVTYINDCRAQALSEAIFGAGRGFASVMGLNLGTGLAGGIVVNGKLLPSPSGTGGEFGHFPLAAAPMMQHGLPALPCGCGRFGCTETLIAGPGLSRIVAHKTGHNITPEQIVALRKTEPNMAECWQIWLELLTDLMITLTLTVDPACVVLGGGLARVEGLINALSTALRRAQLVGYGIPEIRLAEGGDATGARGAAYAAHGGVNG